MNKMLVFKEEKYYSSKSKKRLLILYLLDIDNAVVKVRLRSNDYSCFKDDIIYDESFIKDFSSFLKQEKLKLIFSMRSYGDFVYVK
mgnify:CR=1 FL=1|jgi:hypothetical protein